MEIAKTTEIAIEEVKMSSIRHNLKKGMAQTLFKGGLRVVPLMSDQRFMSLFESKIQSIPRPDAREFISHLLLCTKRAITAQKTRKAATKMLNLIIRLLFEAEEKRKEFLSQHGFEPPILMVLSPTMRCNLRCYGCYAGEYNQADDLDAQVMERIVNEAKEMGIFFIVVTGGEPFISQDVLRIWEKHPDILFQVYTNGTLIDQEMARRLAEYGNVVPCISVEGYESETDARRGKNTYARIMAAMDNLRQQGVLFGFSATATKQNNELISSNEFVDFYINKGCFIGWYFNYIPIGRSPDMSLMPTPQQRIERWKRIREMRRTKPIILADFWCDGSLTDGCIACSRYFHINNRGDVEPCVFAHFAADNIENKSLAEALNSQFFRAIKKRQPYCSNLLRPCQIIDNPVVLREVVKEGCAYPTHTGAETIINELAPSLDKYAAEYGVLADQAWDQMRREISPAPQNDAQKATIKN
jgi:MoaA/NifB/PqqE/SkfB family radical SAM enzyme